MSELIKSCWNYTGGKYKLLPQILPLFPDNINTLNNEKKNCWFFRSNSFMVMVFIEDCMFWD